MDLNQEFVEQLEEIDNYAKTHNENQLTNIVLKQIRQDFVNSYLTSVATGVCEHKKLIDEGCFDFLNHAFIKASSKSAKYHKYFCPACKNEIIFENKEKTLVKF